VRLIESVKEGKSEVENKAVFAAFSEIMRFGTCQFFVEIVLSLFARTWRNW
jgi:hypothetical protein